MNNFDKFGILTNNKKYREENPEEFLKEEKENKKHEFNKILKENSYNAVVKDLHPEKNLIWILTSSDLIFLIEIHIDLVDFKFEIGDKVKIGINNNRHILYDIIPPNDPENLSIEEQEKAFKELGGDY